MKSCRFTLSVLLVVSLASGMCGIAYEILYARLLTTYLGDMFFVSAAILATFLLGIAFGSLAARRLTRWLWLIELLIGVRAVLLAFVFARYGHALLAGYLVDPKGFRADVSVVAWPDWLPESWFKTRHDCPLHSPENRDNRSAVVVEVCSARGADGAAADLRRPVLPQAA